MCIALDSPLFNVIAIRYRERNDEVQRRWLDKAARRLQMRLGDGCNVYCQVAVFE